MNILYITPYTPTPIRTRPYNLIRAMAQRGHTITLGTVHESKDEERHLELLKGEGIQVINAPLPRPQKALNMLTALFSGVPLQARFSWQPTLGMSISKLLSQTYNKWDIIHIEHLRGAIYGVYIQTPRAGNNTSIPIVWDSVDSISLLFSQAVKNSRSRFGRWVTRFELARTRCYERHLVDRFERVLVTSLKDKLALESLNGRATNLSKLIVLPNGVDLESFRPGYDSRQDRTVVFSGKMSYHANITAAMYLVREIMPVIWVQHPEVLVQIVGKDPPAIVKNLEKSDQRVQVTGTVPDVCPYLQQAGIAIAPVTYGAGIQNKVLEAMACATPVVATSHAVSALQATAGRDLLVEDEPTSIAMAIINLIEDPDRRKKIGVSGRAYVERYHDWMSIAGQLEKVYSEIREITDDFRKTAR